MKKRLVIILMALVTVSAFAGCGSKTETTAADYYETAIYDEAPATEAEYSAPAVEADYSTAEVAETAPESNGSFRSDYSNKEKGVAADACFEEYIEPYQAEKYQANAENGFTSVKVNPVSTFAADVDTASYSNVRRMIEEGCGLYGFPKGSVRVEEMINYFSYDYAKPKKGEVFGVDATVSDCPWNEDSKLMVLGISAESLKNRELPASNIVFLVDVSGSMKAENKLPLLKDAMELLVDNLDENDRVSIVTYASGVEVVLEGVPGDETRTIMRSFNELEAGGSTNGSGGIELAYRVAEENYIEGGNNRVIIASDGDFNVGATSQGALYELISEKKESGIFLSALGFGMRNYNDVTMETLADNGNGNYAYIDTYDEAKKVLDKEFKSTLYTVAKDTKLQVEFNPALVSEYRLIGYENRALTEKDFTDDSKDGGEIGAGHQITVMYEIKLSDAKKGKITDEWCNLAIAYKNPDGEKSEYREFPISENNYTKRPSEDYIFAACVAEAAMALNDSEYLEDVTREQAIEDVVEALETLDNDDSLRVEFAELMGTFAHSRGRRYN